ncbi:hypothetical protein DENIS_4921 [Desulfonema ishimotonii]|uniref:Uncharacterized protein n=1 Tax=Desulfonema ishimotonii TaxID=45657 RepID=A0A401G3V3_9BACT|nr:bifunctional oligoribonuclease/PAP phosphatase NrnA [Desulfonema ishimotonii]GBC63922.1 hypothetical protein DENIS_4921 [Desulfonema ishimotonii]
MEMIIRQLKQADRILVTSHINPDGDAIGALIAMGLSLEQMGKTVTLYNESPIPAVYRFLPSAGRIVAHTDPLETYDAAVVLDCGDIGRIGGLAGEIHRIPVVINIDHHMTNTRFGHLNDIDTAACATAEIVYRFVRALKTPVTTAIATAIYTGIFTDTGSFRFANTNNAAFSICNEMVAQGVEPYVVARHVYGTYSLGRIKLLNLALDSIEILNNGQISVMTLTRDMLDETGTRTEDIDGMINYARGIEDVRVAVLIQEQPDEAPQRPGHHRFHVSLRSDGSIDVGALASTFGGGGHYRAAGFTVNTTLSGLKGDILDGVRKCDAAPCNPR